MKTSRPASALRPVPPILPLRAAAAEAKTMTPEDRPTPDLPPQEAAHLVQGLLDLRDSLTLMSLSLSDYLFELERRQSTEMDQVEAALRDYIRRIGQR